MARTPPNTKDLSLIVKDVYQLISSLEVSVRKLQDKEPTSTPVAKGTDGNIALFGSKPNFQGGDRIAFIEDCYTAPIYNAAGGVFLFSNAGRLKARDSAGIINIGATRCVYKTADETVNNSNTYQDDDHLAMSVEANSVYSFEFTLIGDQASATPGIKFQITGPASSTASSAFFASLTSTSTIKLTGSADSSLPKTLGSGCWLVISSALICSIHGILITSTTAGTLTLQWAQDTADASNTKVLKGSSLIMIKH